MQKSLSSVDIIYNQVKTMAANFEFKPDERINEGILAKELGTSRTPLREALNRLVAEGFLNFQTGRGFFCRSLEPSSILDLYEARQAVECEALRLAVGRVDDADIVAIKVFLGHTEAAYTSSSSSQTLVEIDEEFHLRTIRLSGNRELERILENLNARVRYIRWIDMNDRRSITPAAHLRIIEALERRDVEGTVAEMRNHIHRRSEEATDAVKTAFSQLYVPDSAK